MNNIYIYTFKYRWKIVIKSNFRLYTHHTYMYVSYTINMTRQGTMRVSEFICVVSEQSSKYPFLIYIHLLNLHLSFGSNIPHVHYNMYLLICVVRAQIRIYAHIWSEEWGECIQFYLQQFSINHVLLIQSKTYIYIYVMGTLYILVISRLQYTVAHTRTHAIAYILRREIKTVCKLSWCTYVCIFYHTNIYVRIIGWNANAIRLNVRTKIYIFF